MVAATAIVTWFGLVSVGAPASAPVIAFLGAALAGALGVIFQVVSWVAGLPRTLGVASASVRDDELRVIGERGRIEVPLAQLRRGTATREGVLLRDASGREIRIPMPRPVANRLLDDLGVGPGRRRYGWTFRERGIAGWALGAVAGLVGSVVLSRFWDLGIGCPLWVVGGPLGAALGAAVERRWWRVRVTVGFDGLHVARGSTEAWMRFDDVTHVGAEMGMPALGLASGRRWVPRWQQVDRDTLEAIQARLVRAHALAVEQARAPEPTDPSADEIVVVGAYRTRSAPPSDLDETRDVLESPLTADEARVEAARVLVAAGTSRDRELVALVADACGHPGVRAALRGIAGGR